MESKIVYITTNQETVWAVNDNDGAMWGNRTDAEQYADDGEYLYEVKLLGRFTRPEVPMIFTAVNTPKKRSTKGKK